MTSLPQWDMNHLRAHLQAAVDLEFWTIPYYMTSMYSIKDSRDDAYRLIFSVCKQEMFHTQSACNLMNAFGFKPEISLGSYEGTTIPHLDFRLDTPNPATTTYSPFTAELGPLDAEHINGMCLIEYPMWDTGHSPNLEENVTEYGSLGDFYAAVSLGVTELKTNIRANKNQISEFGYSEFSNTITKAGDDGGLDQALTLIEAIVEQGEGKSSKNERVPAKFQAVGSTEPSWPHYDKFTHVRSSPLPEVYSGSADPTTEAGREAQRELIKAFRAFLTTLNTMFSTGSPPSGWFGQMEMVGSHIRQCWVHGAIPKFR